MRERGRRHTALEAACLVALAFLAVVGVLVAVPAPPRAHAAVRDPFEPPIFELEENGAILLVGNSQMSCPTSANTCATARASQPPTTNNSNIDNNNFTMAFLDLDGAGRDDELDVSGAGDAGRIDRALRPPGLGRPADSRERWVGSHRHHRPGQVPPARPGGVHDADGDGRRPRSDRHRRAGLPGLPRRHVAGPGGRQRHVLGRRHPRRHRRRPLRRVVAGRRLPQPRQPLRNLAIFEGFADVTTNPGNTTVTVPISGFLTPATGTVNASVGFVTWEGDRGLVGEQVRLNGTILSRPGATEHQLLQLGSLRRRRQRHGPQHQLPEQLRRGHRPCRRQRRAAEQRRRRPPSCSRRTEDFFYPGIITTQIDLYTPAFNPVSKTVTNLSGNSPARVGDTLEYQLSYTNTGIDFADGAVVTDVLPPNVTFVPGSIVVTASPGGVNNGTKTDAAGDDIAEYVPGSRTVRVRIGTGATATAGGTLAPNTTVTLRFRVTLDRASSGTTVINGSTLAYRARTIARDYTFVGNTVGHPGRRAGRPRRHQGVGADVAGRRPHRPVPGDGHQQRPERGDRRDNVDTLPLGATFVSASAPAGTSCAATGQVVTCTVGTLANGASVTVTISATIDPGAVAGSVVNTATVASATSDDVTANNSASASTQITTLRRPRRRQDRPRPVACPPAATSPTP